MSNSTYNEDDERDKKPAFQDEKKVKYDFITEERLHEILSIIFPWGYSHYKKTHYTGASPYIGDRKNIITVVANDEGWGVCFLSVWKNLTMTATRMTHLDTTKAS